MSDSTKLYESDHPYYCEEHNYFSNDCHSEHASWADFMADEGDSDFDMNLVFRWDWSFPKDDETGEPKQHPDPYYRDGTLKLFYMGQRKGRYRSVFVSVCRADEPAVREWLTKRWEHLRALWAPLSGWTPPLEQPDPSA